MTLAKQEMLESKPGLAKVGRDSLVQSSKAKNVTVDVSEKLPTVCDKILL